MPATGDGCGPTPRVSPASCTSNASAAPSASRRMAGAPVAAGRPGDPPGDAGTVPAAEHRPARARLAGQGPGDPRRAPAGPAGPGGTGAAPELFVAQPALALCSSSAPAQQLLDELRFARAKELLQSGDMPIYRIAEELGFSGPACRRAFQRWSGQPPSHLRA